jgi:hypothetical protein
MEIQHSMTDGCLVVAVAGSIDLVSVAQVQHALLKDLSGEPLAVICDLAGVDTLDPVCATVFATVANLPSSRWPATSFLLCGRPAGGGGDPRPAPGAAFPAAGRQPPGRPGRGCGPAPVPA